MSAIFKREMRSYFTSPIGYIVVILYTLLYGFFFTRLYQSGMPDMSILFGYSFTLTLFLMPVLTMRLFSEERRQKTDQALFTAPVNLSAIVLGKFFAALCVFLLAQVTTLVFELIFAFNVSVDGIGYFCCLLGSTLAASALIAVGIFISSLTESQICSPADSNSGSPSPVHWPAILPSSWLTSLRAPLIPNPPGRCFLCWMTSIRKATPYCSSPMTCPSLIGPSGSLSSRKGSLFQIQAKKKTFSPHRCNVLVAGCLIFFTFARTIEATPCVPMAKGTSTR